MATERQIEANRKNAQRSTGPKTEEGKARSRENASKHGLASTLSDLEPRFSSEFEERRARWAAEQNPVGEAGNWAMDRAIAATFRIERCERAVDEVISSVQHRAALCWVEDRNFEAATIFGRLAKDPVRASRRLQTTKSGADLLIDAWVGLVESLEAGDWSESDASKALDLLGVDPDLRNGRTMIDDPDGDPIAFRKALAFDEIERLEALRDDALIPLDAMERRQGMAGHVALLSKQARLLLRYERDAWKQYRESMQQLKAAQTDVAAPASPPAPPVVEPAPEAVADEPPAPEAEPAPVGDQPDSIAWVVEDARLDGFGLSIEVPAFATERTRI